MKDPANAPPGSPDILDLAGGKYLDRREIINIFAIKLRASYPGLDQHALKRQKEKYEGVKTCAVKGCNRAFPGAKALAQHKKEEHEQKKHDHSEKMYTCPKKECHRHKRSKGFVTMIALREHMLRMKHWGMATFHGADGVRLVEAVTESERVATENGEVVEAGEDAERRQGHRELGSSQQFSSPDLSFLTSMPTTGGAQMTGFEGHNGMMQAPSHTHGQISDQKSLMLQRLQTLEAERLRVDQEMERIRNALFSG